LTWGSIAFGFYILWTVRSVLLVIFAGMLLAVLLRSAAAWAEDKLRVGRHYSLPLVLASICGFFLLGAWFRGPAIAEQIDQLRQTLPQSATAMAAWIGSMSWGRWLVAHSAEQLPRFIDLLPRVTGILSTTIGLLVGLVIVLFLGITMAAEPETYRDGVIGLFAPELRSKVRERMLEIGSALRWWLVARLVSMTAVGLMVFLGLWALRIPLAGTLGFLAALLAFIPNVGPFLSAVPPVLLAFSKDPADAIFVVLLFWAVHAIEGFFVTPLAERAAVHLPPALTLSVQMVLTMIVGPLGLALAAPVTAAAITTMRAFHIRESAADGTPAKL
jgi:predicted PurR-regulated permease PerM